MSISLREAEEGLKDHLEWAKRDTVNDGAGGPN